MKATDLNLKDNIKFDFENGITSFMNNRLVILDSNALGLLRHEIIKELGMEKARALFFKFGYQHGYADIMQTKIGFQFDTPQDLLASGPTLHTWEGHVGATPKEVRINPETREFYFSGIWKNSYEAEQHLSYYEIGTEPVCWSLSGYASGWSTGFWGETILTVEPKCMGKGDDHCEWELKPLKDWDSEVIKPYLEAIEEFIK